MVAIQGNFNARNFTPQQGQPNHPAGMFDALITNTENIPTKDGAGGRFVVEFTTPAGRISNGYNLWNNSTQAREIAHKELSALCYATNVYDLDFNNEGAALRNARCRIEVLPQKKNPEFMEVARVFDMQGNEPGRAPANAQPQGGAAWGGPAGGGMQPQQGQPQTQPPAWGQQQAQPQAQPQQQPPLQQQPNGGGWGSPAPQGQPPQQTQPQGQPQQGSWQQQPAPAGNPNTGAPSSPPWGGGQR